jgi:transcriptional regulator with XRE-family HTH domain
MPTEFGKLLRIQRVQKDITQEELAQALKCSSAYISGVVKGETSPSLPWLIKCAKFFNLNREDAIDFFSKAFSSSKTIALDTDYFMEETRKWFLDTLICLLFLPEGKKDTFQYREIGEAVDRIKYNFQHLKVIREFTELGKDNTTQ